MQPLKIPTDNLQYDILIGTGGIGSGTFFALNGNHTLGREESRSGRFLDQRDYCKLHIVCHYISTLLPSAFSTMPLGIVGNDELGRTLIKEMHKAGMDTCHIEVSSESRTLMSICYLYPDGTGGNLTPDDSACGSVDPDFIKNTTKEIFRYGRRGIALALPEVPLSARRELLSLATRHDFFRVSAFTSAELETDIAKEMIAQTDLLSMNMDEAAALLKYKNDNVSAQQIAMQVFSILSQFNPSIVAAVTAGQQGNWTWDGKKEHYTAATQAKAVNTAGAGDAFLAGLVIGKVAGLDIVEAQQLANLIAGLSTQSIHTINPDLDCHSLRDYAVCANVSLDSSIWSILED